MDGKIADIQWPLKPIRSLGMHYQMLQFLNGKYVTGLWLVNKLKSVFYVSVLLLQINYVITLSKLLWMRLEDPQQL